MAVATAIRLLFIPFVVGIAAEGLAQTPPLVAEREVTAEPSGSWKTPRQTAGGPVLDSNWFAARKTLLYLVPPAGMPKVRKAVGAVMSSRWGEGDWSTKHVFVCGVRNPTVFTAGRRLGLREAARELTRAAGQGEEFVDENESLVTEHLFFLHDPEAGVWKELLGSRDERSEGDAAFVVVLNKGNVAGVVELRPEKSEGHDDDSHAQRVVAEVRRITEALDAKAR